MLPPKTYTKHTPNIHQIRNFEYKNRSLDHNTPKNMIQNPTLHHQNLLIKRPSIGEISAIINVKKSKIIVKHTKRCMFGVCLVYVLRGNIHHLTI